MSAQSAETREDLFEELKFDRAKPAEAEAEAARRGWPPLAPMPDVSAFDPMAEKQWTLPMAMAWIATRSIEAVRLAWNKYRAAYPVWRRGEWRDGPQGPVFKGWLLDRLEPATSLGIELLAIVGALEEDGEPVVMTVAQARDALWAALQEGLLPATGIARLGGGRVAVPAAEWSYLQPRYSDHRDEVGRDGVGMDYAEPQVPAKAILHLWSARREPARLPSLMAPEGDGYMPLYCAARWIAASGGSRDFDPDDAAIWQAAYGELLMTIASERVRVVGLRSGQRDIVAGHNFAGCRVDYPHSDTPMDLMSSDDVYLRSHPYLDDDRWRHGFDDALTNRRGDLWTQLMVEKGDVRKRWPFGQRGIEAGAETVLSGYPGRPNSRHIVMLEFERRSKADETLPTLAGEARVLAAFLATEHPDKPQTTAKTIENRTRERYNSSKPPK